MYGDIIRCTEESIGKLYSYFDKLCLDERLLSLFKSKGTLSIIKSYEGSLLTSPSYDGIDLGINSLSDLGLKTEKDGVTESIKSFKRLEISNAYFYNKEDLLRVSDGFIGKYSPYLDRGEVYSPNSKLDLNDICVLRDEYVNLYDNSYSVFTGINIDTLKNSLSKFKNILEGYMSASCKVYKLYDYHGTIRAGNPKVGYNDISYLPDEEFEFYNTLLGALVSTGLPINSVYFYCDFNWSTVLIRSSSKIDGEFDILIK